MRNGTLTKFLYLIFSLSLINFCNAQWTGSITNPTKVCTASGYQQDPFSVSNGAGGAIVAWEDSRSGTSDIYIDNLSSTGTLLWSTPNSYSGKAVCTAAGSQYIDDMIADASGNVFIVWDDPRVSNVNEDVYIQKFNSSGVAQWTANGIAVVTAPNDQYSARLISDGAGGVIVTWADFRNDATNGDNPQGFAQRISATGAALWAANGVALYNSAILNYPAAIVPDGNGGAIISLADIRNSTVNSNGDYLNIDIYAQRMNSNGDLLWGTNGLPVCTQASNQINENFMTIADGSGGAIFYWYDYRSDPGNGNTSTPNSDVYAQRLNASGATQWAINGIVVSSTPENTYSFKAIPDGSNGAVAFWVDESISNSILKTQRTSTSGANLWTANGITVSTFVSYSQIDVALDNVGGVTYTWSSDNYTALTSQIMAQRIILSTGAVAWQAGGIVVTANSLGAYYPKITTNSVGEAIIIWEDYRNSATTDEDLYANKLNNNGTLPLLWGAVAATIKGKDGVISWETLQELNTVKFEVQRSENASTFTTISTIAAAGRSTTSRTYEALDKDLLKFAGEIFTYRIKQFDLDGNTSISKQVQLTIPKDASRFKLLNNPVVKDARLFYLSSETGKCLIRIIGVSGKTSYSKEQAIVKGVNQFSINIDKLPAGSYYIELVQGNFRQLISMLK